MTGRDGQRSPILTFVYSLKKIFFIFRQILTDKVYISRSCLRGGERGIKRYLNFDMIKQCWNLLDKSPTEMYYIIPFNIDSLRHYITNNNHNEY